MFEDFYSNAEITGNFTKGTEPVLVGGYFRIPEINRSFSFCQN
jgi:hypothetical protein